MPSDVSALPVRPTLNTALRILWRAPDALQLGLDEPHATIVSGIGPTGRMLLPLLDGRRSVADLLEHVEAAGADPDEALHLLQALDRSGALHEPAAAAGPLPERNRLEPDRLSLSLALHRRGTHAADTALRRRREVSIGVHGTSRVGATVATVLAAAGVGRIVCIDGQPVRPADHGLAGAASPPGRDRGATVAMRLVRDFPATVATTSTAVPPHLAVVTTTTGTVDPETVSAVRGMPHLLVGVRETTAIVGPFVLPGRTPCLRCLELTRADRDPHWPALAAQLVSARPPVEACDIALATVAASLAALHVLGFVDSSGAALPASAAGVVEVDRTGARLRRRSLGVHPDCGCTATGWDSEDGA